MSQATDLDQPSCFNPHPPLSVPGSPQHLVQKNEDKDSTHGATQEQKAPVHSNLKQHWIRAASCIPSPTRRVQDWVRALHVSSLGENCGPRQHLPPLSQTHCRFLSLPPSNWKWQATQAEVSSLPPISSHAAPLRAVNLITHQYDRGGRPQEQGNVQLEMDH